MFVCLCEYYVIKFKKFSIVVMVFVCLFNSCGDIFNEIVMFNIDILIKLF